MAPLKTKGDMAELMVAADLVKRGYRIALPFGEDNDFDLLFWRPPARELERVQVKYTESDGSVVTVRTRSHSLTKGKVRATKRYTKDMIDWLAVYDATTDRCYYVPATEFGDGMSMLHLRLTPALNNQRLRVRLAEAYTAPEIVAPTIQAAGP